MANVTDTHTSQAAEEPLAQLVKQLSEQTSTKEDVRWAKTKAQAGRQ
jgi:hypothetical protein